MIRRSFAEYSEAYEKKVLNLGCGQSNPVENYGLDILDFDGVDLVCDVSDGIPIGDNSFDFIYATDFLEHIEMKKNVFVMEEIYRVLKPGGNLSFLVPSTDGNSTGAFQDPTHISFWNQMKFSYFMDDQFGYGFRGLYNIKCWFKPIHILTFNNAYGVTYVGGELTKGVKQ